MRVAGSTKLHKGVVAVVACMRISDFSAATRGTDWSAEFIPQRRAIVNNPAE